MKRILIVILYLMSSLALAAGPFIWGPSSSKDLTPLTVVTATKYLGGADGVTVQAPVGSDGGYPGWTLELPDNDGDVDQVLATNGVGQTHWANAIVNPMSVEGDMIYGGVSGAATRLASGPSGDILQSQGLAAPQWVNSVSGLILDTTRLNTPLTVGASSIWTFADGNWTTTWPMQADAIDLSFPGGLSVSGTVLINNAAQDITNKTLLTVDNLSLNGNTLSTSSGNLLIDPAGSSIIQAQSMTIADNLTIVDGDGTGATPTLSLSEDPDNGSNTMSFRAAASIADFTLTWPVDDGNSGEVLRTDGSGVLTWVADTGFANPMDSAGDMIYGGSAGVATKLDSGTTGQWLVSGGAATPAWTDTVTTAKTIDGSADAIQLTLQGHSTQTSPIFTIENSTGADLFNYYNGATSTQGNFRMYEAPDNGSNYIQVQTPTGLSGNWTWTMPGTAGSAGNVIRNSGSGVSAWSAVVLTSDVSGVLPVANGGSAKALTLAAGGLLWTDADSFEVGAAGTGSDWALSGGTGAPTFSSTTTTAKMVDGSADAIQLIVQGNGTQTSDILVAEKSDGTDLLEVTNTAGTKIRGTTTNDSASAGFVGECIEVHRVRSSATSISNNTPLTITSSSLSVTAGDWSVSGYAVFKPAATTTISDLSAAISKTDNTLPASDTIGVPTSGEVRTVVSFPATFVPGQEVVVPFAPIRVSTTGSNTPYYLVMQATFGASTMTGYGSLTACRTR